MSELAKKPYDRARLDVIAGLAVGPILQIGEDAEVHDYLRSSAVAPIDRLPDGSYGAAVAYDSLLDLSRGPLGAALAALTRLLEPGAPLLVTTTELSRDDAEDLLASIAELDPIRVEARRPYLFEPPRTRVFLTARRR